MGIKKEPSHLHGKGWVSGKLQPIDSLNLDLWCPKQCCLRGGKKCARAHCTEDVELENFGIVITVPSHLCVTRMSRDGDRLARRHAGSGRKVGKSLEIE